MRSSVELILRPPVPAGNILEADCQTQGQDTIARTPLPELLLFLGSIVDTERGHCGR